MLTSVLKLELNLKGQFVLVQPTLLRSFFQTRCFFHSMCGFWGFILKNIGFIPQNISVPSVNFPPHCFALFICLNWGFSHGSWTQYLILESYMKNYLSVGLRTMQFQGIYFPTIPARCGDNSFLHFLRQRSNTKRCLMQKSQVVPASTALQTQNPAISVLCDFLPLRCFCHFTLVVTAFLGDLHWKIFSGRIAKPDIFPDIFF